MPLVSLGLPVFNGERYLAEAVESLLAQTFGDFELIINDNASTDGTASIARQFAARDGRIRYFRNDRTVGAADNFNLVVERSSGSYFKWAACDDACAPSFLERCVEVLDSDPGVVLAYPRTTIIDEQSRPLETYSVKLETDSPNVVWRFQSLLRGHKCYEIFGLIRRDALLRTPLMGAYSHGDGVLLARLALLGRFQEIPEPLFLSRRHAGQSARMEGDRQAYAEWFNPGLRGRLQFPHWRAAWEFLRSIWMYPLGLEQRLRCHHVFFHRMYSARRVFWNDVVFQLRRPFRSAQTSGIDRRTGIEP